MPILYRAWGKVLQAGHFYLCKFSIKSRNSHILKHMCGHEENNLQKPYVANIPSIKTGRYP